MESYKNSLSADAFAPDMLSALPYALMQCFMQSAWLSALIYTALLCLLSCVVKPV